LPADRCCLPACCTCRRCRLTYIYTDAPCVLLTFIYYAYAIQHCATPYCLHYHACWLGLAAALLFHLWYLPPRFCRWCLWSAAPACFHSAISATCTCAYAYQDFLHAPVSYGRRRLPPIPHAYFTAAPPAGYAAATGTAQQQRLRYTPATCAATPAAPRLLRTATRVRALLLPGMPGRAFLACLPAALVLRYLSRMQNTACLPCSPATIPRWVYACATPACRAGGPPYAFRCPHPACKHLLSAPCRTPRDCCLFTISSPTYRTTCLYHTTRYTTTTSTAPAIFTYAGFFAAYLPEHCAHASRPSVYRRHAPRAAAQLYRHTCHHTAM